MLVDKLAEVIEKNKCAENFFAKVDSCQNATLSLTSSARPLFASLVFQRINGALLILISGADAAHSFARQLSSFVGGQNVLEYGAFELDPKVIATQNRCLDVLRRNEHKIIVSSASDALHKVADLSEPLKFAEGDEVEVDDAFAKLEAFGYDRVKHVKEHGEYSFQGGALDVFPGNYDYPVRIDFFGDEIESIKRIFPSTGQSISDLKNVEIYSVTELPLGKKNLLAAKKKLEIQARTNKQKRELLEVLEDGIALKEHHELLPYLCEMHELQEFASKDASVLFLEPSSLLMEAQRSVADDESITAINFDNQRHIFFESIIGMNNEIDDEIKILRTNVSGVEVSVYERIQDWFDAGYTVVFSATDPNSRANLESDLVENGISVSFDGELKHKVVNVISQAIPLGFVVPAAKLVIVSDNDLKGTLSGFRQRRNVDLTQITFPYKPGDYVVHVNFGVAKFVQIVTRNFDNVTRDYMELHYAEEDKLFLPIEQLDRVTRYVGAEGDDPKLTRLDTKDWSRAVKKARAATKKLAFDLVDVYSRRANVQGFAFEISDEMKERLSSTFAFEETPDQKNAIQDVFLDMQSHRVMDRLVCGDVGFGKTEVAIRAAYVAVQNGKQVMLLCPTTILAQQHFETFLTRLEPLGVSVDVISRFRTKQQQEKTLSAFADGKLGVLIGTHRLLSRDVNPKELGLVIVDEEQRFGVGHKEQLKNLRETIDVLTLSATPIPRTLQMSLSGVREMSLILTPPKNRAAVKVHVGVWDPDVVTTALRTELARGGQVYYVSNRVNTIDLVEERVQELCPEARIGIAHGQMTKNQLEHVMEDFAAGELDILIATTIIESGIDNPRTNTLIIEDSQRLGLAQMYQLKGRVGRSNVQAYAYFMFPDNIPLTQDSQARLMALNEHQELGSGLRIAMRDLEIRGAGEMFGAEQSGNMSAVGFDLFAAMLNEAIMDEREGKSGEVSLNLLSEIQININESAFISDDYIEDVEERVLIYRKVALARSLEALAEVFDIMRKHHGEPPDEAINFFSKATLRVFASEHGITSISLARGYVVIEPIELSREAVASIRYLNALYSAKDKRLKVPSRNIIKEESASRAIYAFLRDLL